MELLKVKSDSRLLLLIYIIAILLAMNYLLSSDMFVPSLPKISNDLGVTASLARMMIPFFIIALAIVQLFSGPISDKYGRRPVIIVGCIVYLIASVLCLLSTSILLLLIGRILQGIGCGVLVGLSRTIIQDSLTKKEFTIAIGWISLFFMLAGAISPVIGGLVQTYLSWRFTFGIMLVFIMILTPLIVLYMPETHTITNRNANVLNIKSIFLDYFEMIKHKQFMIYIYYMIVAFSGIIVFYVLGPFIFIGEYGESAQYFGFMTLGLVASAILSRLYMNLFALRIFGADGMIFQGLVLCVASSLLLFIITEMNMINELLIIFFMCIYIMGCSLIAPSVAGEALSIFKHKAGAAGAMYGFLQMLGACILSSVASIVSVSILNLAMILLISASSSLILFILANYISNNRAN